jgi:hypothetical protein
MFPIITCPVVKTLNKAHVHTDFYKVNRNMIFNLFKTSKLCFEILRI